MTAIDTLAKVETKVKQLELVLTDLKSLEADRQKLASIVTQLNQVEEVLKAIDMKLGKVTPQLANLGTIDDDLRQLRTAIEAMKKA